MRYVDEHGQLKEDPAVKAQVGDRVAWTFPSPAGPQVSDMSYVVTAIEGGFLCYRDESGISNRVDSVSIVLVEKKQ